MTDKEIEQLLRRAQRALDEASYLRGNRFYQAAQDATQKAYDKISQTIGEFEIREGERLVKAS